MVAHAAADPVLDAPHAALPPALVISQPQARPSAWHRALTAAAAFLVAVLVGLALVIAAAMAAAVGLLLAAGAFAARLAPRPRFEAGPETRAPHGWTLETTAPRA